MIKKYNEYIGENRIIESSTKKNNMIEHFIFLFDPENYHWGLVKPAVKEHFSEYFDYDREKWETLSEIELQKIWDEWAEFDSEVESHPDLGKNLLKNAWKRESNVISKFDEFIKESIQPDEDDCIISSNGWKFSVSCDGKFQDEFEDQGEAMKCIIDWREENHFYPDIWFISDHGNAWKIDEDGNEIKEEEMDESKKTKIKKKKLKKKLKKESGGKFIIHDSEGNAHIN